MLTNVQKEFMKHKHLIVRAEAFNTPKHEQIIQDWMTNLIRDIDMKIMMGPFVKYCDVSGNKGFTGAAIIETSHVVIHIWDEPKPNLVQLDVYTCSDLDPSVIAEALEKWDCEKIEYKFLDRETGLQDITLEMTSPKKEVII